jgi:hypothetical protein
VRDSGEVCADAEYIDGHSWWKFRGRSRRANG